MAHYFFVQPSIEAHRLPQPQIVMIGGVMGVLTPVATPSTTLPTTLPVTPLAAALGVRMRVEPSRPAHLLVHGPPHGLVSGPVYGLAGSEHGPPRPYTSSRSGSVEVRVYDSPHSPSGPYTSSRSHGSVEVRVYESPRSSPTSSPTSSSCTPDGMICVGPVNGKPAYKRSDPSAIVPVAMKYIGNKMFQWSY
jgi:hypothetical protein